MAEHQQAQKSTESKANTQTRTIPPMQIPISHPAAIIQRARVDPKSLTHADVMQLQRTIGNRAVGQLLTELGLIPSKAKQTQPVQMQIMPEEEEPLQGKFAEPLQRQKIPEEEEPLQGKFESGYKKEICPSCIQRQEIPEEEEPLQGKMNKPIQLQEIPGEEESLQGKFESIQHQEIHDEEPLQIKKENKTGMPDNLKAGVESLSGIDMSDVRVHYNSSKPAEIGALAYTQGMEIHVASGQEQHLPHEAWHVVQQAQGRVRPTMQMNSLAVNDDLGLEREADLMGGMAELKSMPGGTLLTKSHEIKTSIVQCRLGVEIELNDPKIEPKNKKEGSGDKEWDKRDVIYTSPFWYLTIDDTPGGGRFNLEFILNGASRNGFEDDEIELVLSALDSIEYYLNTWGGRSIVFDKAADGKRNGELVFIMPSKMPSSANVQVTTGMSLVGLQSLLESAQTSKLSAEDNGELEWKSDLRTLVENRDSANKLVDAYIQPHIVELAFMNEFKLKKYSYTFSRLCKSLSAMFTLINAFVANYGEGQSNIKNNTPILWKTPLNMILSAEMEKFYEDLDEPVNNRLRLLPFDDVWKNIISNIFRASDLNKSITYPPTSDAKTFTVKEWLDNLTSKDILSEQDAKYDVSFGGLKRFEGGKGPSATHPIFELRSFPNTFSKLKENLKAAQTLLIRLNKRL